MFSDTWTIFVFRNESFPLRLWGVLTLIIFILYTVKPLKMRTLDITTLRLYRRFRPVPTVSIYPEFTVSVLEGNTS